MNTSKNYTRNLYDLSATQVAELTKVDIWKAFIAIFLIWVEVLLIIMLAELILIERYYFLYFIIVFLIAGRQGALLQMVHEGAHMLIYKNKKINDFISNYFCALPIGITHLGYTKGHYMHHLHTGTELDPPSDRDKYRETNFNSINIYKLLLKDLLGISAIQVFISYMGNSEGGAKYQSNVFKQIILKLLPLVLVQFVILLLLFKFDLVNYILFWIVPAVSAHMVLMRIRGIAEHGLAKQIGVEIKNSSDGNFYTRSFLTPKNQYNFSLFTILEKFFIGSQSVYFHHEHHLMPNVPFYNLKKLNEMISDKVEKFNPNVYEKGYFSAAFRNLRLK